MIFAVGRTLRELARSSTVLLYATRADRGLRALFMTADQIVWHYDERSSAPAGQVRGRVTRGGRPAQLTLAEAGWAGSS